MSRFARIKFHKGSPEDDERKSVNDRMREAGRKAGNGGVTEQFKKEHREKMEREARFKAIINKKDK